MKTLFMLVLVSVISSTAFGAQGNSSSSQSGSGPQAPPPQNYPSLDKSKTGDYECPFSKNAMTLAAEDSAPRVKAKTSIPPKGSGNN